LPKVIDSTVQDRFIELRAKGVPYERIAEELNVSKPTLIKWGRELEVEVANAKALERQATMERYFVSWEKRVELLGGNVETLIEELEKRDLSEIPTDKLLDLLLKYIDKLKAEEVKTYLQANQSMDESLSNMLNKGEMVKWKA
jgi:hypothetical protein